MAKYRQIHTTFWQDAFVLDLTPEEKYFYLYLMTNDKTTQCGIYELPKKVAEMQTGYNRETVEKLLNRFIEYGKIAYNEPTNEIIMLNWAKYNFINSPKVKKCIEKELQSVKYAPFKKQYVDCLNEYGYRIDTVSKDYGEEEEKEEEQKKEEEASPFDFYQQNFGVLNSFISDSIGMWIDDIGNKLVIEAMKRALKSQKPWRYAEAICKDWYKNNIKSIDDMNAYEKTFKNKAENPKPQLKTMEGIF